MSPNARATGTRACILNAIRHQRARVLNGERPHRACGERRYAPGVTVRLALLSIAWLAFTVACNGGDSATGTASSTPERATAIPTGAATQPPSRPSPPVATETLEATPSPRVTPSSEPAVAVRSGVTTRRAVALTFDAGADTGFAADILTILRAEKVRASFGVTGAWAEANPLLLRAMAADGHRLINHSYSHDSFTGLSTGRAPLTFEERSLELSRTETTIFRLTNRSTRPWFRPPYGDLDDSVQRDVAALGYGYIAMWTIDTLGWNGASADAIVERTLRLAEPGAIIIMHVGADSQDAAALPAVIEGLRADGYAFETVDEIIQP
jgi:peptidoglycan/xylan/chitin deacetylase (PgdA/CDA1 family)